MPKQVNLDKGIFTFSLDTELAWGTRGDAKYGGEYDRTRDVVRRVLALCEKYRISITWAIVGRLMMAGDDPWWYAPDIVSAIRACSVPQEIGSHSFEHRLHEPSCTVQDMDADIRSACAVAREYGIALRSFVFPKNRVKHLVVLERHGFTAYRGMDRTWFRKLPGVFSSAGHVIDNYLIPTAPAVIPERVGMLWNVPGSYYYVHRRGWARWLPISFRVRKAVSGIRTAALERKIFHLWCHPFNLASDPDGLLSGIEKIFQEVDYLRRLGTLENMTMGSIARIAERLSPTT